MSTFDISVQLLHEQIEQLSLSADVITDFGNTVASLIATTVMAEQKVYSIGLGVDASVANAFCHLIRDGLEIERPNLPIVQLTAEMADPIEAGLNWIVKEIKTIGQPGDVAVIWGSQLSPASIEMLDSALMQRNIQPCWVGPNGPGITLSLSQANAPTRLGLTQSVAIILARLVENTLFGSGPVAT